MTKKDYIALARQFSATAAEVEAETKNGETDICLSFLDRLAVRVAIICRNDNPNFDRQRFITACKEGR